MPLDELMAEALKVRERAYAPYSQFRVGAAVRTRDGRIFVGCNVESSSYGLSICAERSALARAIAEGASNVVEVAVVADTPVPCPPCGACRQLISELGPQAQVHMGNLHGETSSRSIEALLPGAFSAQYLGIPYLRRDPEVGAAPSDSEA